MQLKFHAICMKGKLSGKLFVLRTKNNKNICQNQYAKNTSSNIRIQFCKSLSKIFYETVFLFPFKTFQQQFNLLPTFTYEFIIFIS